MQWQRRQSKHQQETLDLVNDKGKTRQGGKHGGFTDKESPYHMHSYYAIKNEEKMK